MFWFESFWTRCEEVSSERGVASSRVPDDRLSLPLWCPAPTWEWWEACRPPCSPLQSVCRERKGERPPTPVCIAYGPFTCGWILCGTCAPTQARSPTVALTATTPQPVTSVSRSTSWTSIRTLLSGPLRCWIWHQIRPLIGNSARSSNIFQTGRRQKGVGYRSKIEL